MKRESKKVGVFPLEFLKTIRRTFQNLWYDFEDVIYEDQKKTIIYSVVGVILVSLFTFSMIAFNHRVRREQLSYLVTESIPIESIVPLDYNKEDKMIKETQAISVMFVKPESSQYNQILQLLQEREEELNRTFYYYPIVYGTEAIEKKYQINSNKATFVFFEEGEEKNRFTFEHQAADLVIPELNRLPMWTINNQREDVTSNSDQETTETTSE